MSARSRLLLVATVVGMAGSAAPALAVVGNRTLSLPDLSTRRVEVPFGLNEGRTARQGTVTLVVRNRSRVQRHIRIRYAPKAGRRFAVIADGSSRTDSGDDDTGLSSRRGLVVAVPRGDVATFAVTFAGHDATSTPEQAAGRFILTAERMKTGRVIRAPLVLGVAGVRAEERSLTISPASVTLPLTLNQPEARWPELRSPLTIRERSENTAYVDLRGPGAAALSSTGQRTFQVVLRRDDGESVKVTVGVVKFPDNVAQLVLPQKETELEITEPGRYTGTLAVGSGEAAPSVELVVEAKEWWGWAVFAVLIGVLLGRLVPPFLTLERSRRRGRDAIADAIRIYGTARRGREEAASYDLDWLIAPARWQVRGVFSRPQDEPAKLLRDLSERTPDDNLDETVARARALRTRVERWAQVEQAARELEDHLDGRRAPHNRRTFDEAYAPGDRHRRFAPGVLVPAGTIAAALVAFAIASFVLPLGELAWIVVAAVAALVVAFAGDILGTQRAAWRTRRFSDELVAVDAEKVLTTLARDLELEYEKRADKQAAHEASGTEAAQKTATGTVASDERAKEKAAQDVKERALGRKIADLCIRADRERRLVQLAAEVWRRQDRFDSRRLTTELHDYRRQFELDRLWSAKPSDRDNRSVATRKDRSDELKMANTALKRLQRQYPPLRIPLVGTVLNQLFAYGVWAVEALWRTLTRITAEVIRAILSVPVGIARRIVGLGRGWFAVAQTFSLLLTLSVPVIVYVLTLYTDTWGSPLDVLTAFAAGFAGKIALDFGTTVKFPSFSTGQSAPAGGQSTVTQAQAPGAPPANGAASPTGGSPVAP